MKRLGYKSVSLYFNSEIFRNERQTFLVFLKKKFGIFCKYFSIYIFEALFVLVFFLQLATSFYEFFSSTYPLIQRPWKKYIFASRRPFTFPLGGSPTSGHCGTISSSWLGYIQRHFPRGQSNARKRGSAAISTLLSVTKRHGPGSIWISDS